MQDRRTLTQRELNRDLLRPVLTTPLWWWLAVGFLGGVLTVTAAAGVWLVYKGVGVFGLNRPGMWGFMITNFVFWVGISHAGVMLSAILRLAHAEWRRVATRAAEVLTIFALFTAMQFPLWHTGRPWRTLYWVYPMSVPSAYDFARGIWPDIRSPLVWDPTAIFTYLFSTTLFVFVLLVPDIAVIRDRTRGIRHKVYSVLALGWRGTPRQWKLQLTAGFLLSALILPVFVSVHSIVSWDFAVAVAVEGWHATIFAPYFVIGAVHSGVSGVVTVLILLRWLYRWDAHIRADHLDALGRLLIVIANAWFFFFFLEFMMGIYGGEGPELSLRTLQMLEWPYNMLFIVFLLTAFFIPVPLWLFRNVRRSAVLMFWTTVLVNVGMWLERFIIIVPSLARKQSLTFNWGSYAPSPIEIIFVIGSFALVFLGILVFGKLFPIIPLADAKEGMVLATEVQVGKVKVPAVYREE
jgi:molybdopterin-containing oxidoreductase family membrane subunit